MATSTALLDLPPELMVRIADNLTTAELGPLRRTCKQIEASLFDSFANEFFSKRQFMLEHWSLEALVGIANHPGLAPHLTEVLISTHRVEMTDADADAQLFLAEHMKRRILLDSGEAYRMLLEVFTKLPNLRIVGLRDFDGKGRDRDGPDAQWRSWGWSKYQGYVINDTPDPIFPLLIAALGAAGSSPTNLEVMFRSRVHLSPEAFTLPRGVRILGGIKTMFLDVSGPAEWSSVMAPGVTYNSNNSAHNVIVAPLQRFLHQASDIETLRLNFQSSHYFGYRFLEWFACSPSAQAVLVCNTLPVPAIQLEHLRCLDLGMCIAGSPALLRILTKYSLESFSLWKVTLHVEDNTVDHWSELLTKLADGLPSSNTIRTVKIGWTAQALRPHHRMASVVSYVDESADLSKKVGSKKQNSVVFEAKYTAKDIRQWLQELATRTFVPHIHDPTAHLDSDDSESSSDDSDDEMDGEVIDLVSDSDEEED